MSKMRNARAGALLLFSISIASLQAAKKVAAPVLKEESEVKSVASEVDLRGIISDDVLKALTISETSALASLANTQQYEGEALAFRNSTMDYSVSASNHATNANRYKLNALEHRNAASGYAEGARQAYLNAQTY